jgi:hypothetical protein
MTGSAPLLVSLVELGGYPNFSALYERMGYQVAVEWSVRAALATLRKHSVALVVADFFYQRDFRDRVSNLESLLAALQRTPDTRVLVIYPPVDQEVLERVRARFRVDLALPLPVTAEAMESALRSLAGQA